MIHENILEMIGNTPMLKINNLIKKEGVDIMAKIEGLNPGGSIKDRVALKMIREGEASGELSPKKTIIEATSGNTGIALAMIGAFLGYRVQIVMSEAVSLERRKLISAYGADITLTDKNKGTDGAIMKVKELVNSNPEKYFHTDQFSNQNNKLAHTETTAAEIIKQTQGKIDYFVAALGTSGTLMGVGEALKAYDQNIKIISAEPVKDHYIQGLKNMEEAIMPEIYNKNKLDEIIPIDSEEAFKMARDLIKKEGVSVGMSSGAAMLAARKIAQKINQGKIVTIFPDRGEKYLSTSLFTN